MVPSFVGEGLQVQWIAYAIQAAVVHRGRHSSQGHYQAVLWKGSEDMVGR